jgi:hypothetical protein
MATLEQIAAWLVNDKDAPRHLDTVMSYQTPAVQAKMQEVLRAYDCARTGGGKVMPFQEPISTKQVCDYHGLDERNAEKVFQKLVDAKITSGLIDRMGSDDQLPVPEPTLRDQIAAAVDAHSQE